MDLSGLALHPVAVFYIVTARLEPVRGVLWPQDTMPICCRRSICSPGERVTTVTTALHVALPTFFSRYRTAQTEEFLAGLVFPGRAQKITWLRTQPLPISLSSRIFRPTEFEPRRLKTFWFENAGGKLG